MTSNVQITPDTSQSVNTLANLGQQRQQMDQMKLAEIGRNKAYLQDMISKSFANVSGEYQNEYKKMQDEFIQQSADVWKKSDGFLSMDDHLKLQQLKKPLDNYVATYNDVQKMYSDATQKIAYANPDKVDREQSYLKLKELMNGGDLKTKWNNLSNPGLWFTNKQETFGINKFAKSIEKAIRTPIKPNEEMKVDAFGNTYFPSGYTINKDKLDLIIDSQWEKDPVIRNTYKNKAEFKEDLIPYLPELGKYSRNTDGGSDGGKKNQFAFNQETGEYVMAGSPITNIPISQTDKLIALDSDNKVTEVPQAMMENSKGTVIGMKEIDGEFYVMLDVPFNKSRLSEVSDKFKSSIDGNGNVRVYKKLNKKTDKKIFENKNAEFLEFDWETGQVNKGNGNTNKSFGNAQELGL